MTKQYLIILFFLGLACSYSKSQPAETQAAKAITGKDLDELADGKSTPAAALGGAKFHDRQKQEEKGGESLGRVFSGGMGALSGERKLEYAIHANYQIDVVKTARAFFNQWIPRFGFLATESATSGYMNLTVRVRSQNLYAALGELDGIGSLTSENITVTDHTENAVHQQMLAAREDIRNRRRTVAAQSTGTQQKNWEITENLLSSSEDKQITTRMEEWRISDRTQWATIHIALSLPVSATVQPVEVPEFKNAFVGVLNVLLQLIYASIYLIPIALVLIFGYKLALRVVPKLHAWAKPAAG